MLVYAIWCRRVLPTKKFQRKIQSVYNYQYIYSKRESITMKLIDQLIADLREIEKEVELNNTQNANLKEAKAVFAAEQEEAKEIRKEIEESKAELKKLEGEKEVVTRQTEDEVRHAKANVKNIIDACNKEEKKIIDEIDKLKANNQFYFDEKKDKEREINKKIDDLNKKEVSFRDREAVIAKKEIKIIQLEGDSLKKNNSLFSANAEASLLKDKLEAEIKKTRSKQDELGSVMGAYKEMKVNQERLMIEAKAEIANVVDIEEQAASLILEYETKKEAFDKTVEAKNKELKDQASANNLKDVELTAWDSKLKEDSKTIATETRKLNKIKDQLSK